MEVSKYLFWLPIPELSRKMSIPPKSRINSSKRSAASSAVTSNCFIEEPMSKNTMHDSTATASRPGTGNTPAPAALRKSLKNRHVQLIALGGAIGTGLFYGSSESIALAGPSILLAYLVGGLAIFMIVRALGEMSVEDPRAGAFSYYATRYWSKRAGFVSGWNYWFNWAITVAAELVAGALIMKYWFPDVPAAIWSGLFLIILFVLNYLSTRSYGESEFIFAGIKVLTVLVFLFAGTLLILGLGPEPSPGFTNWTIGDAPFVGGFTAMLTTSRYSPMPVKSCSSMQGLRLLPDMNR